MQSFIVEGLQGFRNINHGSEKRGRRLGVRGRNLGVLLVPPPRSRQGVAEPIAIVGHAGG